MVITAIRNTVSIILATLISHSRCNSTCIMYTVLLHCNLFTESERIEHPVREKYCISWVQYLPALAACRFKHSCSFSSTVKRTHKRHKGSQSLSSSMSTSPSRPFTRTSLRSCGPHSHDCPSSCLRRHSSRVMPSLSQWGVILYTQRDLS